ncbi:Uveal autoantigen with coiled-coil/ankyrin [Citrus sinensis]|nr:Uveal autoantigen with coiled-coil/ankyrin [Citrus sinensis]
MANVESDSTPSVPKKENITPVGSKIADLQNWRSKLDTQVKIYRDELTDMKKTLSVEVEQLRSEFQELRNTLQQQQDDVTASLRNLGLQDFSGDDKERKDDPNINGKDEEVHAIATPVEDNAKADDK